MRQMPSHRVGGRAVIRVFGDKYTRNGTVLVVLYPGVSRRFDSEDAANHWLRYYRMCGGR